MRTYVVIATLTNGRHINRTINNVYLAKQLMKMFLDSEQVANVQIKGIIRTNPWGRSQPTKQAQREQNITKKSWQT